MSDDLKYTVYYAYRRASGTCVIGLER